MCCATIRPIVRRHHHSLTRRCLSPKNVACPFDPRLRRKCAAFGSSPLTTVLSATPSVERATPRRTFRPVQVRCCGRWSKSRVCSCSRSLVGHAQTWRLSLDGVRGVRPLRVGKDRAVGDAKVTEDATPTVEPTPETNGAVSCLPTQGPWQKFLLSRWHHRKRATHGISFSDA